MNATNWTDTGTKLLLAAAAAMAGWEISAKVIAPLIMGGPLSPNGLIISLIKSLFGAKAPGHVAHLLHWTTGLVFYPAGLLVLTLIFPRIPALLSGVAVGVGTWFLALGIFAPLANLPFMINFGTITWVSLIGHLAYGLILAGVFSVTTRTTREAAQQSRPQQETEFAGKTGYTLHPSEI